MHRWLGVLLCLSFLVWFSSGLVLLFVPFPSLPDTDRWAASDPVMLAQIALSPAEALQRAGGGDGLRLLSIAGQPRYVVAQGARQRSIDAGNGAVLGLLTPLQARSVAARFGRRPVRTLAGPLQVDQWSVHQRLDPWRPFYRVALDDADGTTLYVSARTGEVMQRTRASERCWNWLGAIPHWLYFTALRRHFGTWDSSVWWLALCALIGALAGSVLGVYRSSQYRRRHASGWSPYRGLLRWHHGLGLVGTVIVLAWIFSGWLSMDHGRLFSRGQPSQPALQRYAGIDLDAALTGLAPAALHALEGSGEIGFHRVGGQLWVSGHGQATATTLQIPAGTGAVHLSTPAERVAAIRAAAARVWPLAARSRAAADALYRQADAIDADALRLSLAVPGSAQLYVDTTTGQPLLVLDRSRQAYAWLYYAVHTTRLPGLDAHPRLHIAVQLTLLAIGWCLSLTGLVLAVRRLRLLARQRRPRRSATPLPNSATNDGQ
ncbi:hypothetical protein CKY51_03980 [Xanthomonas maliensis]|nr:hypothetical protein CKY51_03980 [Xanthomonas maliensis]